MNSQEYGRPVPPSDAQGARPAAAGTYNASNTAPAGMPNAAVNKREKKAGGRFKSFLYGFVGGIVSIALVLCLGTFTPILNAFKGTSTTLNNGTVTISANGEDISLAEAVASKTLGSVVTIYVYSDTSSWNQYFGGNTNSNTPSALGSGVIISDEGEDCYILTNYHVVADISRATVKVGDTEYEATAVGSDAKTDLAVLKIKASGLNPIEWGESASVKVGEWVMAIGTPYGYEQPVTTGIVSALYRSDVLRSETATGSSTVYTDMIQTDAAINPGNSGGALVNAEGKLIGINTYISATSQSSAGLGFAIPVDTARAIAEQLIAGQPVTHAFLGITMGASTDGKGVPVTSVYKDTAAAKAGLQTGDIITKIDGKDMTSASAISIAVSSKKVGDTIEITYTRNGNEATTTATLGSDDASTNEYAENGAPATRNGNGFGGGSGGNGFWH